MKFGFVGPSYALDNVNADAQTCMNWHVEKDESGAGNSPMILEPTPGLQPFANVSVALSIAKSHAGNFTQGQTGTFQLVVTNTGAVPTSGSVVVSDTLPPGLTLKATDSPLVSDNFTRANVNPLAGNWTPISVSLADGWAPNQIISNAAYGTQPSPVNSASYWNALTPPADQYVEITLGPMTATSIAGAALRVTPGQETGYFLLVQQNSIGNFEWSIFSTVNNIPTLLANGAGSGTPHGRRHNPRGSHWDDT